MEHVLFLVFLILISILWALLEIQIEGANGWAALLPTWRYQINIKYLWKNEVTGYHVFLMLFIITMLHTPFLYIPWNIAIQIKIIAFYMILIILEDFLWFVLNPHFGINKFGSHNVPWHASWFLGLPMSYWAYFPGGVFLYFFSLTIQGLV
jgi:hypothetical protein